MLVLCQKNAYLHISDKILPVTFPSETTNLPPSPSGGARSAPDCGPWQFNSDTAVRAWFHVQLLHATRCNNCTWNRGISRIRVSFSGQFEAWNETSEVMHEYRTIAASDRRRTECVAVRADI